MADIPMTEEQKEKFKQYTIDRKCMNDTLEVALIVHSNTMSVLHKQVEKLWYEAAETHGFDLADNWRADYHRGVFTQDAEENRT